MKELKNDSVQSLSPSQEGAKSAETEALPRKGPFSFLSGALTSALFAWLSFVVSKRMVEYFAVHSIDYSSAMAQSIASGLKTLLLGISFLATFSFTFIGLGLFLVFIRSLFGANNSNTV